MLLLVQIGGLECALECLEPLDELLSLLLLHIALHQALAYQFVGLVFVTTDFRCMLKNLLIGLLALCHFHGLRVKLRIESALVKL